MAPNWPAISYDRWAETCDTLHAHTQILGKLAVALAPPEPELQHAALRLTARGYETEPLPAPDGSGSVVVALDLHAHEAVIEHSSGAMQRVPLTPDRPVADVTRDILAAVARVAGPVQIYMTPQEVPWKVPLDEDYQHARYDPDQVRDYFTAASQAALALTAFRAPYRGRESTVNAWWGTFDISVIMFSGAPADPPGDGYISRNSGDAEQIMVGWWPGDASHLKAAFYAFAHPTAEDFARATLTPDAAHWDAALGQFLLDWDDVRTLPDPQAAAVEFAHSAFRHGAEARMWDVGLISSADGTPPPIM